MKLTEQEILEGNKLIAMFMCWTKSPVHGWLPSGKEDRWYYGGDETLLFDESWDWLMPVVDKINAMGKGHNVAIFKTYISLTVEKPVSFGKSFHYSQSKNITPEQTGKEAMFRLLVDFIKWDNIEK